MKIIVLCVFTFSLLAAYCKTCPSIQRRGPSVHRFGPECGFMCHCKYNEQCDVTTGECRLGCASMWYGPGCQYRDIAEGAFSRQSDSLIWEDHKDSNLANDGNLNTCSYTAKAISPNKIVKPFWRVWFPTRETIRELMIVTLKEALQNFRSFAVYVEDVQKDQKENNSFIASYSKKCYKQDDVVPNNKTMFVLCESPIVGNQVRIELAALRTQLVLCDVKINGGRNIAFGRVTSQRSQHKTCEQRDDICTSSQAVDGDDQQNDRYFCSYTKDEHDPSWQLDIGHQAQIWYTRILSLNGEDLSTVQLSVSKNINGVWDIISNWLHGNISLNLITRFVKLTKPGSNTSLVICEVKVFGDCLEGVCGYDCSKECHCKKTNIWDKISGSCSSGCKERLTGRHCNLSCDHRYWGPQCNKRCGHCTNSAPCDVSTGECPNGCQWGYNPPKCSSKKQPSECPNGTYGPNCSFECSGKCHTNALCDKTDGHCPYGCIDGYTGSKCDQKCDNGKYGVQCSQTCPVNCKEGTVCNYVNGQCDYGCRPGFHGDKCEKKCDNGKYGVQCSQTCPVNCKERSVCNNVNGHCDSGCSPGFRGDKCEKLCDNGKYGLQCSQTCPVNCIEGTVCNKVNGHCDSGCTPGFLGDTCEKKCSVGKYGQNCSKTCSSKCKNDKVCDKVNGTCYQGCIPGYQGEKCEYVCSKGSFGDNCSERCGGNCLGGHEKCHHINGSCTDGCIRGWKGPRCNRMCDIGFYGEDCRQNCSGNCKDLDMCSQADGSCKYGCKDGWIGKKCEIECVDGFHGANCTMTCGNCKPETHCDKVLGTCVDGCAPGFDGDKCLRVLQVTDSPGGSILGITAALTSFLIISTVVAVAIIYVRRKRRLRTKERRDVVEQAVDHAEYVNATATTSHQDNCSTNKESRESTVYANAVYADVSKHSTSAIPLSALAEHVETNGDQILVEFQKLPFGMQYPSSVGVRPCNRGKNRYRDMFAYDHSRVVLESLLGKEGSDYINACFIQGYLREKAYIAAQGPVEATIDDFWRMLWEKDVTTIAMLTNLVEETKAKCLQYWPVVESSSNFGDFLVRTESEMVFAEFTIREFHVSCGREPPRSIRQFHYTAWPDKSVPRSASSLLHFWRKVRKNDETKSHPWLVHCSAGVGRTGTFIATDMLYDQAKAKGYVDIYQCVGDLRKQRVNMVQTKGQYKFLYGLMTETFVITAEPAPLESFDKMVENLNELDSTKSKTKLFLEYKILNEDSPYIPSEDNNEDMYLAARLPENKNKNRCSDILPPNEFRPFLLTKLPNCSDYINAVYMPSYCETNCYILTQLPMKTTAIDCCRLVYEEDVKVIVTFDEKVKQEVGTYLPENGMIKLGPFTVLKKSEEDKNIYRKKMFIFSYGSEKREIIQLAFKAWTSDLLVPSNPHVMMKFIQEAEYYRRSYENKPVIVQCLNGSEKCGLYVAVVNVLERARFDNEVSIPQVIRELRVRREQIIPNFEQFKFCYDVLLCHIENDSMYANM